ncbi:MAG: homocysteine S-methyltransferase family protein, partial [Candidatus Eisenbacteria bacterium]
MTASDLRQFAAGRVLIFEGALGTMLQEAVPGHLVPELLNAEHADAVVAVHTAYDPLSDVICTNTFGGSSLKLSSVGLAGRARELNARGAELARRAAGPETLVAGDVGPTGRLVEPLGDLSFW